VHLEEQNWDVDKLHALPDDGNRYELIDGELFVSPAPSRAHQRASRELVWRLLPYVELLGGLEVLYAPFAVTWSTRTEVQPDVLVVPLHRDTEIGAVATHRLLELVVEILSPSTARVDRYRKRALYQKQRVAEYWIVDLATRMVERWRPDDVEPEVLFDQLVWRPRADVDTLSVDLEEVFRIVHAE
ncbi:MAG: Uma2 family endonuclease, partial [Gemmatimonadaceae bacterium]